MAGTPEARSESYWNIPVDGAALASNSQYWAMPIVGSSGGPVLVHLLEEKGKVDIATKNSVILNGHKLPVMDLAFSPFETDILVTGSDDSMMKVLFIRRMQCHHHPRDYSY